MTSAASPLYWERSFRPSAMRISRKLGPGSCRTRSRPTASASLSAANSIRRVCRPCWRPRILRSTGATFASKALWVSQYHEDERYPTGDFPNQHPVHAGLPSWTEADRSGTSRGSRTGRSCPWTRSDSSCGRRDSSTAPPFSMCLLRPRTETAVGPAATVARGETAARRPRAAQSWRKKSSVVALGCLASGVTLTFM